MNVVENKGGVGVGVGGGGDRYEWRAPLVLAIAIWLPLELLGKFELVSGDE